MPRSEVVSDFRLWSVADTNRITNWVHTITYLNWSKIKKIHPIVSNKTHGLANSAWGQVWKAFFGHHYIWNKQWSGKTLYVTPFSLQNIRLLAQLLRSLFVHLLWFILLRACWLCKEVLYDAWDMKANLPSSIVFKQNTSEGIPAGNNSHRVP